MKLLVRNNDTGETCKVKRGCIRCGVTDSDLRRFVFVLSPTGIAHYTGDYPRETDTACGKDATGPDWWWPT